MLFSSSLLAGLMATMTIAAPAQQDLQAAQDLQGMAKAFDLVFSGIDVLNAEVEKFSGPADTAKIVAANDKIATALTASANELVKSATIAVPDLLNIFGPVFVMENRVGEVVDTLGKNKDKLKAGNAPVVEMLTKDRLAADTLVKAVVSNLPLQFVTSSIAGPIAALITTRLDKGITEWGGAPPAANSGPAPAADPNASSGLLGGLTSGIGSLLGGLKGSPAKGSSAPKGTAAPPKGKGSTPAKGAAPPATAAGGMSMPGMSGM
jgi:hypothetical protein